MLLGYPKEQFSDDAESSLPLYHFWSDARASASTVLGMFALDHSFCMLYGDHSFCVLQGDAKPRSLAFYAVPCLPEPAPQRESASTHCKARSSDSFGLSWTADRDCLNAEQFETGWEKGSKESDGKDSVAACCACGRDGASEGCRYGSCYRLLPLKCFGLHALTGQATRLLLLPAVASCSLTKPFLFTGNEQGVIELWNLDWMARKWSLAVQDGISFIGATQFAVQMHVSERESNATEGAEPEQGSFVSLHHSSPSAFSPQSLSFSQSLSFLDDASTSDRERGGVDSRIVATKPARVEGSFVDLQELDKIQDRSVYSRILVVGTRHGRMLLMEEKEGRVLFDVNVMDVPLDCILISSQYSVTLNNEHVSSFVLTCANYETGTFYSLLFTYSGGSKNNSEKSAPLTVSEFSPLVEGSVGDEGSEGMSVGVLGGNGVSVLSGNGVSGNGVSVLSGNGLSGNGVSVLSGNTTPPNAINGNTNGNTNITNGNTTNTNDPSSINSFLDHLSTSSESVVTMNSLMRVSTDSDMLNVINEYCLGLFYLHDERIDSISFEEGATLEALRIVIKTANGDVGTSLSANA